MRYTTDGSDPTETAGTLYSGPVRLGTSATLKAVAYLAGWTTSPVTAGDYSISTLVAAPVFAPRPGRTIPPGTSVITTSTPEATIRYTVDGTTPTDSYGTVYSSPVPRRRHADAPGRRLPRGLDGLVRDLGPLHDRAARARLQAIRLYREFRVAYDIRVHDRSRGGDARGGSGLPFAAGGTYPWCLAAHPSGKFLYVLNYSSRDISILGIDAATGALAATSGSPCPTGGALPRGSPSSPRARFTLRVRLGREQPRRLRRRRGHRER
ncbi:MAG: chitobiase/beta-hexosaminidase C-terminal domain-containing protein [Sphingobacterium sp.]|nr:chitobiase/beta-hexosaminidase C-terminal domain-containing protein [Sphingobacterium sp.]